MNIRESAAIYAARLRRFVRSRRDPLGALIYESLLDGPPASLTSVIPLRWPPGDETVEIPCGFCRKTTPHAKFREFGPELGVVFCTWCGWGRDNQGTFDRASTTYGERLAP